MLAHGASCYLAYVDERAVATGTTFLRDGFVGVFNVATSPRHRRRGYASQSVADGVGWLQAGCCARLSSSLSDEHVGLQETRFSHSWTLPRVQSTYLKKVRTRGIAG